MGSTRRVRYSYEEYTILEDLSPVRHEFLDGEIYAMAGGSPDHAALAASIFRILGTKLPPGCRAFISDLRIRIHSSGLTTYPDGSVVCGSTARAADDRLAVTNPVLLIEVTSPSTEEYDRGEKLRHYKELKSLCEVLIISHQRPHLALHRRLASGGWEIVEAGPHQSLMLESVRAEVAVDDVYRDGLEDATGT